jgi:hypothetical protein
MELINRKIHTELLELNKKHFNEVSSKIVDVICENIDVKIRQSIQSGNIALLSWNYMCDELSKHNLPIQYVKELLKLVKQKFPDYNFKEENCDGYGEFSYSVTLKRRIRI